MKKLVLGALLGMLFSTGVSAQTTPGLVQGQVPTPAQWNSYFAMKQDLLAYTPCSTNGCSFSGSVITAASAAGAAGFNIAPGVAPTSPNNGDFWITSSGLFVRVNGATNAINGVSSAGLDTIFGSTRGSILERGASGWQIIAPGTSGLPWVSKGPGADPGYAALGAITVQQFTSGSSLTYTPTAGTIRARIRMCGGGGGGGSQTTNNGGVGGTTSFGSWTTIGGGGGVGGTNGSTATSGGTGGTNGTGTLVVRVAGGGGQGATGGGTLAIAFPGGMGGVTVFGGAGAGNQGIAGTGAAANTCAGGGGGGSTSGTNQAGSGGAAGEYVEFWVANPGNTTYTVGAGGSGGAAGGNAGGNGAAGNIIIEEYPF